jgi:DNA-binding NtrC family response regulator
MSATVAIQGREVRRLAVIGMSAELSSGLNQLDGYELIAVASYAELLSEADQQKLNAVVIHFDPHEAHDPDGFNILAEIRKLDPNVVIVAVIGDASRSMQARAAQWGADDVVALAAEVPAAIGRAEKKKLARVADDHAATLRNSLCDLIGASEPMQRLYDAILRVADSTTTVMIRGESGTGKELVARAIVALGPRSTKTFVRLNCAALPESLIESELFGHEKGAFTGAVVSRPGHIEMAHGGTLFLDEIATLPLALQTKLLRVIEDRAVQRLGGSTWKKIDFRLLTATNENLEQLVREGKFREDLYYRIQVVPISVPPLRDRTGDIPLLADRFLRLYCSANNLPQKRLDLETLEVLEEGSWPGNIRELENLIQRLVLMVEDKIIGVHHLPEQILFTSARRHESLLIPPEGIDFDKEMERIEAAYLRAALLRTGGKKVAAAAVLRVNEQRMKYLCRKYKIEKENG